MVNDDMLLKPFMSFFEVLSKIFETFLKVKSWKAFSLIAFFMVFVFVFSSALLLRLYFLQMKDTTKMVTNLSKTMRYNQLENGYAHLPFILDTVQHSLHADAVLFVVYQPKNSSYFAHAYSVVGNQQLISEGLIYNKVLTLDISEELKYIKFEKDHFINFNMKNIFLTRQVSTYVDQPVFNQNGGFVGSVIAVWEKPHSLKCPKNFGHVCTAHIEMNLIREVANYIMGSTYNTDLAIRYVYHGIK